MSEVGEWDQLRAYALNGDPNTGPLVDPELRSLKELAPRAPTRYRALVYAAESGRLRAVKRYGNWYSRREWIDALPTRHFKDAGT
jgi:hypothetical protein